MDYSKEIKKVLSELNSRGHSRDAIEEKLGYATNAIDQSLARGGSKKILRSLQLYLELVLKNSTLDESEHQMKESELPYGNSISQLIHQQNKLIISLNNQSETANSILKRISDNVELKIEMIDSNLADAVDRIDYLKVDLLSQKSVILKSLERLEGKKPGTLVKEEGSINVSLLKELKKQGSLPLKGS